MARIKRAVNSHKKRRKTLKLAKGFYGAKISPIQNRENFRYACAALCLDRPAA